MTGNLPKQHRPEVSLRTYAHPNACERHKHRCQKILPVTGAPAEKEDGFGVYCCNRLLYHFDNILSLTFCSIKSGNGLCFFNQKAKRMHFKYGFVPEIFSLQCAPANREHSVYGFAFHLFIPFLYAQTRSDPRITYAPRRLLRFRNASSN